MRNWLEFLNNRLSDINFDHIETKETDLYTYKFYQKDGTYLSFDLINNNSTVRKVECGKYWPIANNDYEVSSAKAVFDKTKRHLIDFLQVSFDSEYGEKYELDYNDQNKSLLNIFLKIPLENGWSEKHLKYEGFDYKIQVDLNLNEECLKFEIILMHYVEQDLPMLGDKFQRRIYTWWADLKRNEGKRDLKKEEIKPIKNNIAQSSGWLTVK
jgi:hypothetical protein